MEPIGSDVNEMVPGYLSQRMCDFVDGISPFGTAAKWQRQDENCEKKRKQEQQFIEICAHYRTHMEFKAHHFQANLRNTISD